MTEPTLPLVSFSRAQEEHIPIPQPLVLVSHRSRGQGRFRRRRCPRRKRWRGSPEAPALLAVLPAHLWRSLVCRRNVRQSLWTMDLSVSAIDQFGQVIDVLVAEKRDLVATRRFFTCALEHGPHLSEVTTD